MYPPLERLVSAFLLYGGFTLLLARIQECSPRLALGWLLVGGLGGFLLALILRLMDELKDSSLDRRLFPERPVPSGRVRLTDIRVTLLGACIAFLVLHLGTKAGLLSAAVLLGYTLLMFRYFFLPQSLRSRLLVNLATHNPVVALLLLHYVVLFAAQYGIPVRAIGPRVLILVALYWSPLLAWELGRKVRYPEEESDYQTYSRILGPRSALAATWLIQTLTVLLVLYLWHVDALPILYPVWVVLAYLSLLRSHTQFLLHRLDSGRRLKGAAEQFAVLVMCAAPADLLVRIVREYALS